MDVETRKFGGGGWKIAPGKNNIRGSTGTGKGGTTRLGGETHY